MSLDVAAWLAGIRKTYGVNPLIFGALYLAGVFPFWLSIYKIIAGLKNKDLRPVRVFGFVLGIAIILPFLYVAVFGRNLPYWFWIVGGVIILFSLYSGRRRLTGK